MGMAQTLSFLPSYLTEDSTGLWIALVKLPAKPDNLEHVEHHGSHGVSIILSTSACMLCRFWKYVSNLERRETRRYLQMFYVLMMRPLMEKVHPSRPAPSSI